MTTGGFHLLSGLAFASLLRGEKYRKAKWGIIWGSIFPDIDLIASVVIYLATGDFALSEYAHRTVTHSWSLLGMIPLVGLAISLAKPNFKWVLIFSISFTFGMFTHIIYDLLDGYVAVLAPFSFERYSITHFSYERLLGATYFKVWNSFDGMSDVLFYLPISIWALKRTNINREIKGAKILIGLAIFSVIYFSVLMGIAFTPISVDDHYILIYAVWGTVICPISTFLIHIFMRETIQDFSFLSI
ncbi:MAG: hypothetical protein GF383_08890 [Candidatus Lokiarchaeota archaeon]|nr:hypothetical protein [Candidatus Lokiarchaeota archaeon]MBD3340503.1 hypothetical protein [Candidatus Lokiarchaeota archaeon]